MSCQPCSSYPPPPPPTGGPNSIARAARHHLRTSASWSQHSITSECIRSIGKCMPVPAMGPHLLLVAQKSQAREPMYGAEVHTPGLRFVHAIASHCLHTRAPTHNGPKNPTPVCCVPLDEASRSRQIARLPIAMIMVSPSQPQRVRPARLSLSKAAVASGGGTVHEVCRARAQF